MSDADIQNHRRQEALALAREILTRDPLDAELLAQLRRIIPREEALEVWLSSANGWLSGQRPVDVWRSSPSAVVEAAHKAVAPLAI